MATLALAIGGALIAGEVGSTAGIGFAIGSMAGGLIDRLAIFRPESTTSEGPALPDLQYQKSAFGSPLPVVFGTIKIAGNVIWMDDPDDRESSESQGGGWGKGGHTTTFFTRLQSFAVAICEGEIGDIIKIWMDQKIVYDKSPGSPTLEVSGYKIRIYPGSETQDPDPLIDDWAIAQGYDGAPGFRGVAYAVFEAIPLKTFGNRIPNITFEVAKSYTAGTTFDYTAALVDATAHDGLALSFRDNMVFYQDRTNSLNRIDLYPELSPAERVRVVRWSSDFNFDDALLHPVVDKDGYVLTTETVGEAQVQIVRLKWEDLQEPDETARSAVQDNIKRIYPAVPRPSVTGSGSLGGPISWDSELVPIYAIGVSDSRVWCYRHSFRQWWLGLDIIDLADYSVSYGLIAAGAVGGAQDFFAVTNNGASASYIIRIVSSQYRSFSFSDFWDISAYITEVQDVSYCYLSQYLIIASDTKIILWDTVTGTYVKTMDTGSGLYSANSASAYYRGPHEGRWWVRQGVNAVEYDTVNGVKLRSIDLSALGSTGLNVDALIANHFNSTLIAQGDIDGSDGIAQIYIDRKLGAADDLDTVITALAARAGLSSGDIDVTDIAGLTVPGYAVSTQTGVKNMFEPLLRAYYLDAVESDGKLKFIPRGLPVAATLTEADLGAHEDGQEAPPVITIERRESSELPQEIDVTYLHSGSGYEPRSQRARRAIGTGKHIQALSLPLVLSDVDARKIAETILVATWLGRYTYHLTTHVGHVGLDPADVIQVDLDDGTSYVMRVVSTRFGSPGLLEIQAVAEEITVYDPPSADLTEPTDDETIAAVGNTLLLTLDIPLIDDLHDYPGYYLSAVGFAPGWLGANILVSRDGWESQSPLLYFVAAQKAVYGVSMSAFAAPTYNNSWDKTNSVKIYIVTPDESLTSASRLAVLNGANMALLGAEIIQWQTAVDNGDGTFTLSNLLRGRRGTEWAMSGHAAFGEKFILLDPARLRRHRTSVDNIGVTRDYAAVTHGQSFGESAKFSFADTGVALKPYAGVHVAGTRDGSDNLTVTWVRRTRVGGGWRDYVDAPVGEASEAYEVDIMSGSTVVRTITGLSTPSAYYSAADQTTDFGSPQSSIDVKIYQLSEDVGRGTAAEATV